MKERWENENSSMYGRWRCKRCLWSWDVYKRQIPDNVIEIAMLIYRFIFIFLEEVHEIYKSQEMKMGYMGMKNSYNSLGLLVNMLYKRMMKKYEDMSIALDMKLFDGKFHI